MSEIALVITRAGMDRFTRAQLGDDIDLTIAEVALTDTAFVAAPTLTALPGAFRRLATLSGRPVGDDVVHMIVRDDSALTYGVRGLALFLADGTLFAAYGQPDRIAQKATVSVLHLALDIAFPTGTTASLVFGATDFLNPLATTDSKGVVELATRAEGLAGTDPARVPPVQVAQAMMEARLPAGSIVLWAGAAASVPSGWVICDGRTVPRLDGPGTITTPDLRGRVAVGASPDHAVGTTFGKTIATSSENGRHSHEGAAQVSEALTGVTLATATRNVDAGGSANGVLTSATLTDPKHTHQASVTIETGGAHDHTVDVTQPSIALHYIMRL